MSQLALSSILLNPFVIASLVAAPFIYLGALALGRWLKKGPRVQLGLFYQLLCLSLAVYIPLKTMHFVEHPNGEVTPSMWAWEDDAINHFGAALILLGVLFILALVRRLYWQKYFRHKHQMEAPKFLQQIFSFVAFTVACVLVAKWGYGAQVDAFLTGSGIVAVVFGFAMQETLANIISGVALQIGKPFKVGDWLVIENASNPIRAEVVELNWRSTKLRTNDDVYIDIPNKTITSSTVTNLSYPTRTHANRLRVGFEYDTPPNVVREIIRRAAAAADGVLPHPPVKVFLKDFADSAIVYEIKYSLDDEGRLSDIENEIRTNLWYEARRAGVHIPYPIRMVHLRRDKQGPTPLPERARNILRRHEMLAPLNEAQQQELLSQVSSQRFGRGEHIIHQGAPGSSMFIILEGDADVFVNTSGQDLHVATLREGDAFGEMCLLTGEPRTADVIARTDCEVWELRRSLIQPLIHENVGLADRLSKMLAKRKMHNENLVASFVPPAVQEEKTEEYARSLLQKISAFFEL